MVFKGVAIDLSYVIESMLAKFAAAVVVFEQVIHSSETDNWHYYIL